MNGYRPDDDEPRDFDAFQRTNALLFALLAPPAFGLFLLLIGLHNGGVLGIAMAVIGASLLAATPFIGRAAWRGGLWD